MDYSTAVILAIIEGISEFLPISSTGHLILTSKLLQIQQTNFIKSFEIIIQLGAILAVVTLYGKQLLYNFAYWKRVIVAFFPTAIFGIIFYKIIKDFFLGNAVITLYALFIGGIFLIILELLYKEQKHQTIKIEDISLKQAFLIGLFQSIAMIPGVSRSAATISGGMIVGLQRGLAAEFSFVLAIPTMAGATALDLIKNKFAFSSHEYSILSVGFIMSFVVAYLVIKWFIQYIQTHTFIPFAIYRIGLAFLFWVFVLN